MDVDLDMLIPWAVEAVWKSSFGLEQMVRWEIKKFSLNIYDVKWSENHNQIDAKRTKMVEMRNDSPLLATGDVSTTPLEKPPAEISIRKGLIVGSQICKGWQFTTGLCLPDVFNNLVAQFENDQELKVDLTNSHQSVEDPLSVDASIKVELASGNKVCGAVQMEQINYEGAYTGTVGLNFNILLKGSLGESYDMTPRDLQNEHLPTPFKYDGGTHRIGWPIEGTLSLRSYHKKIMMLKDC